jgi:hypothetical protein
MVGLVIHKMEKSPPEKIGAGPATDVGVGEWAGERFLIETGKVRPHALLDGEPERRN